MVLLSIIFCRNQMCFQRCLHPIQVIKLVFFFHLISEVCRSLPSPTRDGWGRKSTVLLLPSEPRAAGLLRRALVPAVLSKLQVAYLLSLMKTPITEKFSFDPFMTKHSFTPELPLELRSPVDFTGDGMESDRPASSIMPLSKFPLLYLFVTVI